MKILILFCTALLCASGTVQAEQFQIARTVKLGRSAPLSNRPIVELSEIAEPPEKINCDVNCLKCNDITGRCLLCTPERYISENLCLICPEKNYCNGEEPIPNCTDVSCLDNATAKATDTGCCCIPLGCEDVSCKTGSIPVVHATGCCCI